MAKGMTQAVRTAGARRGDDALEALPFTVVVLDADLTVVSANLRARRLTGGRDDRDPVGRPFLTGPLSGTWTPPVAPLFGIAADGASPARGVHTNRFTGSRDLVSVSPDLDASGAVRGFTVVAQPADPAAEEADRLGRRVRFLEGVLDGIPVPALVLDRETGVVLLATAALAGMVGVRAGELVGERAPVWFASGWDHCGAPGDAQVTLRPHRGPQRPVRVRTSDIPDGRGRVLRTVIVLPEAGAEPRPRAEAAGRGAAAQAVARLTPRRREVLELLCQGLETQAIADRLVISEHTARNHVQAVLRQLGCRSRLAAVALAFRAGLCAPPP